MIESGVSSSRYMGLWRRNHITEVGRCAVRHLFSRASKEGIPFLAGSISVLGHAH